MRCDEELITCLGESRLHRLNCTAEDRVIERRDHNANC
jgi:hypothetical protein